MIVGKRVIEWITFNAFLDTDLYIVKELAAFYCIDWHIIRSDNDKFEYMDILEDMKNIPDLQINLHVCGERLRKIKCIPYYNKLFSEIHKKNPDVIFTSMAGAPYFIPVLALKAKKNRTIVAIHNVHVPKGGSSYYFFKFYNKFTISCFYHFQTFSKSQYEELKLLTHDKHILYAPFILKDYGRPTKERTSQLITFLNFGNIREYKRIDVLIEAAQQVFEKTGILFRVIIAGKCDEWEKYQKLIRYDALFDLRIARIENEDVPNLFAETDYFVAPYQDIAQSGSSVVALNYEKPIIASKLPAFEEYIKDKETGYLIKPANIEDLANVMEKIVRSQKQDYPEMVARLKKERLYQFSTEVIVKKYREFIDDVIAK